jgi:predicted MFS family arabinose efflux permease
MGRAARPLRGPHRTWIAVPAPIPPSSQTRAIVLLSVAGFASQAQVRAADTVLPQLAQDLGVTVGAASVVVSSYLVVHGAMQLFMGLVGDRFAKYRVIAVCTAVCAVLVAACGLTHTLTGLTLARVAAATAAAWIIPLSMAFIGDVVPYEQRQAVLGRYLAGQITGQMFGQAAGGIIGDAFGWRAVFLVLGAILAIAALALIRELATNSLTRMVAHGGDKRRSVVAEYISVLATPWARVVMLSVFLEGAFMFGAFAYVGADLNARFALNFTVIGLVIGTFAVGGLIYAASVKQLVARCGQTGLAAGGGLTLGLAYLILALAPAWWVAPIGVTLTGLGFYMLHNTLQTNATQMVPEARGTAVALFSAALYMGQPSGVALIAPLNDRFGAAPVFVAVAILLPVLGLWFARRLRARDPV